tara:strand:+ start:8210 stop:8449 length:240 start_codon:yes stop_codon:yes gene_type:complete
MNNIWKKLPMDLVNKIMSYQPIESPSMKAYKSATIRPIFSNELNCNISGEITLSDEPYWEGLTGVDAEYYMFLLTHTNE